MYPENLIHLGDLRLTIALTGAVTVWLFAAYSSRSAAFWCIAAGSALGIVGASKIMYLGWGVQSASLDFKAASGHAVGAAAVLPVALYLLAMSFGRRQQAIGLLAGCVTSIAVAVSLVIHGEHTVSEALAGWCVGSVASGVTWLHLRHKVMRPSPQGICAAVAVGLIAATCMPAVPAGWWMIKTALALSGERTVHPWGEC